VTLVLTLCCAIAAADDVLPEKPPGEFFPLHQADHKDADSFKQGRPVVGTTYFYWYDVDTSSHIIDGDGIWKKVTSIDGEAIVSAANPHSDNSRYLYFDVDGAFAYGLFDQAVIVTATYRDMGCSAFYLEYDNSDPARGLFEGAFRKVGDIAVGDTGAWKTAEFTLTQCRFMNRCNDADFRIVILGGELELAVSKVEIKK